MDTPTNFLQKVLIIGLMNMVAILKIMVGLFLRLWLMVQFKQLVEKKLGQKFLLFILVLDMVFNDPVASFSYSSIGESNRMDFVFVELVKQSICFSLIPQYPTTDEIQLVRSTLVKKSLIANTAYTRESGESELKKGIASAISYGTLFLANPDMPKRFEPNEELNQADRMTMFGGGEKGFIDYPSFGYFHYF